MKKIIYTAIALLTMASCTKTDEVTSLATDSEVRITSSIATRTTGSDWDNCDEIGVYMATNGGSSYDLGTNVKHTNSAADGATAIFSSTTPLYYPASDNVDLLAYYPYVASTGEYTFDATKYPVVVTEQGDQGAIDLMVATATNQAKTASAVNLTFDHKLSRIQVTLKAGAGLNDATGDDDLKDATVKLLGTDTKATFDLTATTSQVTLGEKVAEIALKATDTNADGDDNNVTTSDIIYEAIVIPQTLSGATLQITTSAYGTFTANITTSAFTVGNEYIYTATINRTGVSLSSATINPWGEGNNGGEGLDASPVVYSYVEFKRNESNTANITKVDTAGAIESLLSKFRRCLMSSDGFGNATICYLDDSNSTLYYDSTAADLTGEEGDVMVYFPEYWYKYENVDNNYFRYHFSESEVDGYVHVSESLVGAYKGYVPDTRAGTPMLYSHSGETPTVSVSQENFIEYSTTNRGTGYQIIDYEQHCTIAMMLYAKYEDRNLQDKLGAGGAEYDLNNTTGSTNSLGNADTVEESTRGNYVNGLAIEGVFGGIYEWVQGVSITSDVWTIANPTESTTRTVTAYSTSSGWITAMAIEGYNSTDGNAGYSASTTQYLDMVPTAASDDSDATYYADYYYRDSGGPFVLARSHSSSAKYGGVAFSNADYNSSSTYTNYGSRLAFRGKITEAASVAAYKNKISD